MPDISMCKGEGCPINNTCYRHTAKPSMLQSYFIKAPYNKETGKCEYHWPNGEKPIDYAGLPRNGGRKSQPSTTPGRRTSTNKSKRQ